MTAKLLRGILLAQKTFGRKEAIEIAECAAASASYFSALMECLLSNESRLVQRAAWSLGWAARKRPDFVLPYIGELVTQLQRTAAPVGLVRNCASILQEVSIPEEYQGMVMNTCFTFATTPETPAAIKAFSLTILYNLSLLHPDIQQELKYIIEEQWEQETPAFRSRGKKILALLK